MRVVVAGYGDVGRRLGRRLRDAGHKVLAIRRSAFSVEPGIESRSLDLCALQDAQLRDWRADAAICLAAPDRRDPAGYERCFLAAPLALSRALGPLQRVLVVTSTATMGGDQGEWVDETSTCPPTRWNGVLLLKIEAELRRQLPQLTIARPSGLYGPGRDSMLRRARDGDAGSRRWTNRIHVEDAAAALQHLLFLDRADPLYCLSDDTPALETEVLAGVRELLALPVGCPVSGAAEVSGRRINNRRLRDTGFEFQYPGFHAGYAALLREAGQVRL